MNNTAITINYSKSESSNKIDFFEVGPYFKKYFYEDSICQNKPSRKLAKYLIDDQELPKNIYVNKYLIHDKVFYESKIYCLYSKEQSEEKFKKFEINIDKKRFFYFDEKYKLIKKNDTIFIKITVDDLYFTGASKIKQNAQILFPVLSLKKNDTIPFYYSNFYRNSFIESNGDTINRSYTNIYYPSIYKEKLEYYLNNAFSERELPHNNYMSKEKYVIGVKRNYTDTMTIKDIEDIKCGKYDFKKTFNVRNKDYLSSIGVYSMYSFAIYQKDTIIIADGMKIKSHLFHLEPNNYEDKYILKGKFCIDTKYFVPVYNYYTIYELNNNYNTTLALNENKYFKTFIDKNSIEKIEKLDRNFKKKYPTCESKFNELSNEFLQYPRIISKPK